MIPRTHFLIMLCIVTAEFGVSLVIYPKLPSPTPVHWNIEGKADQFGPPWVVGCVFPAISLAIAGLLTGLPLLGPFRGNFEKFREVYGRICIALMTIFFALQVVILLKAIGNEIRLGGAVCFLLGLLFIALGNWMGKLRRNFYIGIRTPWTIANDLVWERTHRLGGRLMVGSGVVSAVTGLFAPDEVCFYVLMSCVGLTAIWSCLYSFWVYRRLGRVDELS